MTEEAKEQEIATDVKQEQDVGNTDNVSPVEATEEQPNEKQSPKTPVDNKEYNWRRMEKKIASLEQTNNELNQSLQNKADKAQEPDEFANLQSDDLVTYGQLEKLAGRKAEEAAKKALESQAKAALPEKTKAQFPDFDQVVTQENIEKLVQEDPDLEHDIKSARNPYSRAYKAIKQSDFYREQLSNKANSERMKANSEKPISSNSVGNSGALSKANAYASWSNEELLAEMNQCSRKAASVPNMR